jgi:hypothetical protein
MKTFVKPALIGALLVCAVAPATAQQGGRANRDPATMFAKLDADKDGGVTKAEWVAAGQKENRFSRVDTDGSGTVSLEEAKAAAAAMAKRRSAS